MSSENMWEDIERRAISSLNGVRIDDDDTLTRVSMNEAPMNPHRGAAPGAHTGGPGMMPPMMMGGGGRGGTLGADSGIKPAGNVIPPGGGSSSPSVVTRSPTAAGSTTQTPHQAGGGSAGAGGGGVPAASADIPTGGGARGGGASLPTGGIPAGEQALENTDGTTRAGVGDFEPIERGELPDGPSTPPGQTPSSDGAPSIDDTSHGSEPQKLPGSDALTHPGTPPGGGVSGRIDGFNVDPDALQRLFTQWDEARALLARLDPARKHAQLGLITVAERPQQGVFDSLHTWLEGATRELSEMEARLRQAAGSYVDIEQSAEAELRRNLIQ